MPVNQRILRWDRDAFILKLVQLHYEAHKVGLHMTAHLLHDAVRKSGYELAELIKKAQKG